MSDLTPFQQDFAKRNEQYRKSLNEDALFEMATMCHIEDGYGIKIEVLNRDEHNPPHAHVADKDGNKNRFLLFKEMPTSAHDIQPYPGDDISQVKNNIFKWASSENKPLKKAGITATNWAATVGQWNTFLPNMEVKAKTAQAQPSTP